jgi:hypothetical protein
MIRGMAGKRIRHEVRRLRQADSGRRFEDAHERHRIDNHVVRILVIVLGFLVAVAGAVTFWLPGPQVVIVVLGVALMASQWRVVARLLDRIEVRGRTWHEQRWEPYPHKGAAKAAAGVVFLVAVVLVAWFAHAHGLVPGWVPFVGN